MSPLVRRFLASAAVCLGLGVALGLWLLIRREVWNIWPTPHLVSAHAHLVLVGTVLQVIVGVALWMFPRPPRRDTRHREHAALAAWWLLMPGTLLRAGAEASRVAGDGSVWRGLIVTGAVMQVLGLLMAIWALRTRVRVSGATAPRRTGRRDEESFTSDSLPR